MTDESLKVGAARSPLETERCKLPPDLYSRNFTIALLVKKLTEAKIPAETKLRVLDVGGYGGKMKLFLPSEVDFVICDQKEKTADENANYVQADAKNLPFAQSSFDVVIASELLEHIPENERTQVLEELLRVSKNGVVLGAPFQKNYVENIENIVCQQYFENTGVKHPFLFEHAKFGLPREEMVEQFFQQKGCQFFKVAEGNLINWSLQQLSSGAKQGEPGAENLNAFYRYANEHFAELGNFREPTYRKIFCISKNEDPAQMDMKRAQVRNELEASNNFSIKTFSYLLKVAFTETRKLLNHRKKQLNILADQTLKIKQQLDQEGVKFVEQKAEFQKLEQEKQRLRALLKEQQQAIQFLRAVLQEKSAVIEELQAENAALQEVLKQQEESLEHIQNQLAQKEQELQNSVKEAENLKKYVLRGEESAKEKAEQIKQKNNEIYNLRKELEEHQRSLAEIRASTSWKIIMVYSKVKVTLFLKPLKAVRNGWNILANLGPKVFWQRFMRKIKSGHNITNKSPYDIYTQKHTINVEKIDKIHEEQKNFSYNPIISIVMPVYNIAEDLLIKAITSVQKQTYTRWELCIADDASTASHIKPLLEKYAADDVRIKVCYRTKNGGIVKASNDALKLATGAYVGLLDNDDELSLDALFEVVSQVQEQKYDLLYSDEDKLDMQGNRCEPTFKPDWSSDLLLSCNYISHFGVYRRKILNDIGGFREGFDGSQDYDLVLRFTEKTSSIKHIPKILYHWRKIPGSTAESIDAKPYAYTSAKKALQDAIKRRHIEGEVLDGMWKGSYRVKREIKDQPLVSIIIPFKDKKEILENCLNSIFSKTTYKNYEIILINNRSETFEMLDYLRQFERKTNEHSNKIKLFDYDAPFNYSAINNFAVTKAQGEILILLNNDTEVITPDWIEAMLEHIQRPKVGAVGAKLLYPTNTIQHAGVIIGLGGLAGHAFTGESKENNGYFGQINVIRNYSAVTAACIMIRKSVYEKMEGLNEKDLAVAFNDVDFCLRLREKDYLIVYTPYACLYHYESLSRGFEVNVKEIQYMQQKYAGMLAKGDPYYNPNLTLERPDFSLRCLDKVL